VKNKNKELNIEKKKEKRKRIASDLAITSSVQKVIIWLDGFESPPPDTAASMTWCRSADQALKYFKANRVSGISLGFDVRGKMKTEDLAHYIVDGVIGRTIEKPVWRIHGNDPSKTNTLICILRELRRW